MKRCIKSSLTEKTAALSASQGLRTSRPRAGIASLLIYDWKLSLREEKKTVTLIPISLNTNINIYIWEILRPTLIGFPTSWIVWSIELSIRHNSLLNIQTISAVPYCDIGGNRLHINVTIIALPFFFSFIATQDSDLKSLGVLDAFLLAVDHLGKGPDLLIVFLRSKST